MSNDPLAPLSDIPPPVAVLRLATAYQASQALHVAARLGIPDLLAIGPRSSEDLARATGSHPEALHRLLRALVAFDVVAEVEPGRFALTPLGSCLRADAPDTVRPLVLMFVSEDYWQSWGMLEPCVRTGRTAVSQLFGFEDTFAYHTRNPEAGVLLNEAMTALSAATGPAVAAAYDFADAHKLVDVGGGHGQLIAAILQANPALSGILFDLPYVVDQVGRVLAEAGVAERCEVVSGDMFASVPAGGDVYVLSRVIHDWDDGRAAVILRNCRGVMAKGARLLLIERVLPERIEASPMVQNQVLSDLNMLVRTGGRERTEEEYRALLAATGFELTRIVLLGMPVSLVEAAAI